RLVGRIGGSEQPFMADRAMFVLVDPSVKLCGEDEPGDDHCPTPYDFCITERSSPFPRRPCMDWRVEQMTMLQ
ncbi:MAG: hypothetical protein RLZ84_1109, partial [Actinomycetota bacterium]